MYSVRISREHCLQSCLACESVNYTKHSKVDFIIYDYTQDLDALSATVHRTVELSLIHVWAQVACKLTTGADLTIVAR